MKSHLEIQFGNDPTPSREVAAVVRREMENEAPDDDARLSLTLIHYRGDREEYDLGCEYASSADPLDRVIGARILGQLGWEDCAFLAESVPVLISMLGDEDSRVIAQAAHALGHRHDAAAIPALVERADHPDSGVRLGVACGLSRHDDPGAIHTLIELSKDPDSEVRDWAIFGLGSMTQMDTPEIREALVAALEDPDLETRGEAMVGLAERGDERVKAAIRAGFESDKVMWLTLEAASLTRDACWVPYLKELQEDPHDGVDENWRSKLEEALSSCGSSGPRQEDQNPV